MMNNGRKNPEQNFTGSGIRTVIKNVEKSKKEKTVTLLSSVVEP
jgi:hypothetical protein